MVQWTKQKQSVRIKQTFNKSSYSALSLHVGMVSLSMICNRKFGTVKYIILKKTRRVTETLWGIAC